ncbi:MAG: NDP-sugar synthase [Chloroflexi bacterium]|nr:NDP-sugar synthase [Chloroflexota bacterium]
MLAIVLVGGEGTRMRPLSAETPKHLMPIVHRPLLEQLLDHLRMHGVDRVRLALRRPGEAIEAAVGDGSRLGLRVDYTYEDEPLGSGGAIAHAAAGWDEPFLVCNGDIITDLDVTALVEAHRARGAELSLSLHEVDDPSPFGVVVLDAGGRITRFVEKPPRAEAPSRLINAGTWLFEPGLLREMDGSRFNRVEDGLFPRLAAEGRAIVGFRSDAYWIDVGRPESLLRANLDRVDAETAVAPGASVAPTARVELPAVVGAGSTLEAGAAVSRSLLWERVTVGAGAVVRDSVLATGVIVGAGAVVERSVIAHGAVIAAGAWLVDEAIEPRAYVAPAAAVR